MTRDDRIHALLDVWEESRRQGVTISAAELCANYPELLGDVKEYIEAFQVPRCWDQWPTVEEASQPETQETQLPPEFPWIEGDAQGRGYRLVGTAPLGAGAYGVVWAAESATGVPVAIKIVPPDMYQCSRESRALDIIKHLRHEAVLPLFDYWHLLDNRLVICTQRADRTLLDRLIEAQAEGRPGIPGGELRRYMRQIASALDFLRKERIQHCDVKPSNIFLIGRKAYLGDFSLVRRLSRKAAPVTSRSCPSYAPPEFFNGQVSLNSDQFSLAVTYCELRGGFAPFPDRLTGSAQVTPNLNKLPEIERAPVARALAAAPNDRWPNCRAFARQQIGLLKMSIGTVDALECYLLNYIQQDIRIAILRALHHYGLTQREAIDDYRFWNIIHPRNDSLALQTVMNDLPDLLNGDPATTSISREDVFWATINAGRRIDDVEPTAIGVRETLQGCKKEVVEEVYRILQQPVRLKRTQRRIVKALKLDVHVEQRKYLQLVRQVLNSTDDNFAKGAFVSPAQELAAEIQEFMQALVPGIAANLNTAEATARTELEELRLSDSELAFYRKLGAILGADPLECWEVAKDLRESMRSDRRFCEKDLKHPRLTCITDRMLAILMARYLDGFWGSR